MNVLSIVVGSTSSDPFLEHPGKNPPHVGGLRKIVFYRSGQKFFEAPTAESDHGDESSRMPDQVLQMKVKLNFRLIHAGLLSARWSDVLESPVL